MNGFIFRMCATALALLAAGCSDADRQEGPLVLAAASLQDSLTEAADAWAEEGHSRPVLSFAATSALARQVEAGAPADLFISADEQWMDEIASKGLIEANSRTTLVANRLVLIAPAASSSELKIEPGFALSKALDGGRLAIADPEIVPAGRYAKQALVKLGAWNSVAHTAVPAENVRLALALVAREETTLGIVYATDAKAEPGVRVVDSFPADSHTPITYPIALLKTAKSSEAQAFREFLISDKAKAIFRQYGFEARAAS